MPTTKKTDQVARIKRLIEQSGALYFADLSTLAATEMTDLRRRLRREGIRMLVVKNRLAKKALVDAGISADLAALLRGPTSLVAGVAAEPYAPARLLRDAGQRFKTWRFKGAWVEQTRFDTEQLGFLAAMPTRPELLGQFAGLLLSPVQQLVWVLDGTIGRFVRALEELEDKREKEPAPAAAPPAGPEA